MISAYNITFYELMTAGFISAATYRFISPKERLYELSLDDINNYDDKYKLELLPLFKDENTYLAIAYKENLKYQILAGDNAPFELLDECLDNEIKELISIIGRRVFLIEYVYCTEESLKTRNFISDENINTVISFRNKYCLLYRLYSSGLGLKKCKFHLAKTSQSTHTMNGTDNSIQSGEGFDSKDFISIDDDAVSTANLDCRKYVLFLYSLDKAQLNLVIDYFISLLRHVPIRTWNGIKALGYRKFLINYLFADSIKLLGLRNFGQKSLFDFEKIKSDIIGYIKNLYNNGHKESLEESLEKKKDVVEFKMRTLKERIGESQYKLVTDLFAKLLKDISVRSRNGIKAYKGDFIEDFVENSQDIKSINNIGRKSESEITLIIKKLREYIATLNERELSEKELIIIEKQLCYDEYFDEYANAYYLSNGHLPMFYMLEKYFKSLLSTNRDFQIYNLRTPIFCDAESLTLDEIADQRNLTRERVRQIYMKFRKHLSQVDDSYKDRKEFSIAKFFDNNNDWNYVIDELQSNNCIDLSMLTGFCAQENHNFTDDFMLFLIGAIVRNHYVSIGKPILPYPTKSNYEWNNCYLIKKELTDKFDFTKLFELIEEYEDSNSEDIEVTASEMIIDTFFSAWIDYDSNIVDELSEIVTTILIKELGMIPDDNFKFTIEGKKEENVADILYDILKANGNPLSCEELYVAIDAKYPNRYKSPASIRMFASKDPRLCYVGANNLIGLLEWNHIKIGSIRDIIAQYLAKFDEPQHISQIAKYVQRYRDTTEKSIRATMISGEQFAQFSGGLYGLKDKQYPKIFYLDESDRNFEQRIRDLEFFLRENKHFPFMPSTAQEESLYRWWNRNKNSLELKDSQKSEIERIKSVYKTLPTSKRNYEWFELCNEYYDFVRRNGRRPSQHSISEQDLYVWFDKATSDFADGSLNPKQESSYLELCKSL